MSLAHARNTAPEAELSSDRILQLGLGFRAARTLLSAVELDLFTTLAERPLDAETLRERLGLHPRGARDFFDTLVALGLLERHTGVYRNTHEALLYLDRSQATYVGGMLLFAGSRLYPAWNFLTRALRTGRPQSGITDGEDVFDAEYRDPSSMARYARAMSGASLAVARVLAQRFRWSGARTFIDIGAAEGTLSIEIAQAHPHLTGGGFDLPPMRPVFEANVQRHALTERLQFYAGDFFAEPLPAADVLVMGHILHDWNLQSKRELLAKAHAALPSGGALIVYDQMIDDDRAQNVAGLLMSLNMLVRTQGGFDYTRAECVTWMREAGFAEIRAESLCDPYSMIAGIKRSA
jgi:precorrin-6B methylase 2